MKDELTGVFTNKAVIVTGASSGIGEATAREFAKYGSKVMLAARSEDKLKRIVDEIRSLGQVATYKVTDVAKEDDCKALVEATVKEYGTVDILMDVNFWGTVQCTKYALPYILENKGALVGVSSVAGFHGLPGRTGYSASKFAIHGFLETVRIENLKSGMHVMVIAPGFTASEVRFHALTADGSEQGATPRKEEKMMTAEYVAHWILLGIKRKKRNKLLTWDGRFTALLQRIFPEQVDWIYYKAMQKEPNSPLK